MESPWLSVTFGFVRIHHCLIKRFATVKDDLPIESHKNGTYRWSGRTARSLGDCGGTVPQDPLLFAHSSSRSMEMDTNSDKILDL